MDNFIYICHIIGLNSQLKKNLDDLKNDFNIIDLDIINQKIVSDNYLNNLYERFEKLKKEKNDKYKDIEKKMTIYWESEFYKQINEIATEKKKNIFIGSNTHYKLSSKRINLNTTNNFIIKTDLLEEIKLIIKTNLDMYREQIINGQFPLEYLDSKFLIKKKETLISSYKKSGYNEKTFEEIINILKTFCKTEDKNELWISLKEPYNVDTKIYPKDNNTIVAYSQPEFAIIDSFSFSDDEIQTTISNDSLSIKEIKENSLTKLKKKRYLYMVDKTNFLPFENDENKYFSQSPILIKGKEKIENVYDYLKISN